MASTVMGNVGAFIPTTLTVVGVAALTIDLNTGNNQVVDLEGATGTVVLTLNNGRMGALYRIKFIQGSTARQLTWPAAVKWAGATAPTLTATNDAVDIVELWHDGTNLHGRVYSADSR